MPGTAVFFCPRGACTEGTKEKDGCPEHEIRRLLFLRSVKKPHGGEEKKKNPFFPMWGKKRFFSFLPLISTPLRKNLPYVLETRTKNGVFLTRRKKIQFLVPSSDEDRGPDFPNRPGSCTRLPEATDFL